MVDATDKPTLLRMCRVTGLPLDREATTASKLALALAPTDSLSGHLNNALAILSLASELTGADLAECHERVAVRILAARIRLTNEPGYTITAAGALALRAETAP